MAISPDSRSQVRAADAAPLSFFARLFPNDLPISRRLWLPLAVIELLLSSVLVFNLLTMARERVVGMEGLTTALDLTCSFCAVLLFPILMLISAFRPLFALTKYGLLAMALACLGLALGVALLRIDEPGPLLIHQPSWSGPAPWELPVAGLLFPPLMAGLDFLLRFVCALRYGHAYYLAALMKSFQRDGNEGWDLVLVLAVYWGIFASYLSYILSLS